MKTCRLSKEFLDRRWIDAIYEDKPNVIVRIMLYRPNRNPSETGINEEDEDEGQEDSDRVYTLSWASRYGHLEVFHLLLTDQRVNPAARDDWAIRRASKNGRLDVVRLLLLDQRVNPAAQDNAAIR
jgi:hypothetical protein